MRFVSGRFLKANHVLTFVPSGLVITEELPRRILHKMGQDEGWLDQADAVARLSGVIHIRETPLAVVGEQRCDLLVVETVVVFPLGQLGGAATAMAGKDKNSVRLQ